MTAGGFHPMILVICRVAEVKRHRIPCISVCAHCPGNHSEFCLVCITLFPSGICMCVGDPSELPFLQAEQFHLSRSLSPERPSSNPSNIFVALCCTHSSMSMTSLSRGVQEQLSSIFLVLGLTLNSMLMLFQRDLQNLFCVLWPLSSSVVTCLSILTMQDVFQGRLSEQHLLSSSSVLAATLHLSF